MARLPPHPPPGPPERLPPPGPRLARSGRAGWWLAAVVLVAALLAARGDQLAWRVRREVRGLVRTVKELIQPGRQAVASPAPPPASAAPPAESLEAGVRVTLSRETAAPGEPITASFTGLAGPSKTDWISLFKSSDPSTSYGEWFYLRGEAQGTVTFTAPSADGSYEARIFRDWPRGKYTAVARSGPVRVGATPPGGPSGTEPVPTLTLDRRRYATGEQVHVRFKAPRYADNAWLGVIPSEVPHGSEPVNDQHDVSYQYLRGRTEGELVFTAPAAGRWDLRLHPTDSGGIETASVSFLVSATPYDLTGVWRGEDGHACRARQDGDQVWWLCDPARSGQPTLVGAGPMRGPRLTLRVVELAPRPVPVGDGELDALPTDAGTSLVLVHEPPDTLKALAPEGDQTWRRVR